MIFLIKNKKLTPLFLFCLFSLFSLFFSFTYKNNTHYMSPLLKYHPPSKEFWFGCDHLGRDLFARTWEGTRLTLFIAICSVFSALCIGGAYATFFTFSPKERQEKLHFFLTFFTSIPSLLPAMYLHTAIDSPLFALICALTFTGWRSFARTLSLQMVHLKKQPFVQTSLSMGASKKFIFYHHLLPHCKGSIVTTSMNCVVSCVFTEAFLSFLGLGVNAPSITLGSLINDGILTLLYYPWLFFFPATIYSMLVIVCLSLGSYKKKQGATFLND